MPSESLALAAAKRVLERYSGRVIRERRPGRRRNEAADAILEIGGQRFVVEVKSTARGDSVARAATQLRLAAQRQGKAEPLLVVPSMGEVGAAICEREHVHWVDLHGNASLRTGALCIYVRGQHDAEIVVAEEMRTNPFSKAASRLVHVLLTTPRKEWRRAELEAATGLDKGYLSKIIRELSAQGYVEETSAQRWRSLRVTDPRVLLDAWRERYKPSPARLWGLVAARNGSEALDKTVQALVEADIQFVVGGLGAAAHYTHFGSFRRIDIFIDGALSDTAMVQLRASSIQRGRNVAFHDDFANAALGTTESSSARFTSPVLTYLDLSHLPERSEEAAEEMRRYILARWA